METLITGDDVAAVLGGVASTYTPFLATSQSMVEAYIQAPLARRVITNQKHNIPFPLGPDEPLLFRDGPVTSLTALSIDNTDVELDSSGANDDLILKYWFLKYMKGINRYHDVILSCVCGWTPATLPTDIKNALIFTTGMVQRNPTMTALSERIGDYSIDYGGMSGGAEEYALNARICLMLRLYKRPRI